MMSRQLNNMEVLLQALQDLTEGDSQGQVVVPDDVSSQLGRVATGNARMLTETAGSGASQIPDGVMLANSRFAASPLLYVAQLIGCGHPQHHRYYRRHGLARCARVLRRTLEGCASTHDAQRNLMGTYTGLMQEGS